MRIRSRMLHSSLPADAIVYEANVREGMAQLFRGEVIFATHDDAVDLQALLWTELTLEIYDIDQPDVEPRPFHGIITEAASLSTRDFHYHYHLIFEPSICTLAYRTRSRIFQEKSAEDIIKEVLSDAGLDEAAFIWNLSEEHSTRVYCAQYRESELAFVLRLLEDEGIYYWFEHDSAGHTMHLADAPGGFAPIEGDPNLRFTMWSRPADDCVYNVVFSTQFTHDSQQIRHWDWNQPANPLDGNAAAGQPIFKRYEYPAALHDTKHINLTVNRRLDEAMQEQYRLSGESNSLRLMPAKTIGLLDVQPEGLVGEYLLLTVEHRYCDPEYERPGRSSVSGCFFLAQRAETPFRPLRVTPRPCVGGIDSAVVTGPGGEEIHTNAMCQIKAHLYWDREGAIDDTCSRWIRVQQNNTSGAMILPRIGWEMSVAYVDGDPDRPLALQKLYNNETLPPYGLPDNQTQSSLQSSTSPGGGSVNEVRMQDANGGQEFAVYASRDYNMAVGHDKTEVIAVDAEETVAVDSATSIGVDKTTSIGGDQTVSVKGASQREVVGSQSISVGANDDWGVKTLYSYNCGAARTHSVGSMQVVLCNMFTETVNGNCTRTIDAAQAIVAAGGVLETVGGSKTESVGAAKMEVIKATKAEEIGAAKSLTSGAVTLKAGADVAYGAEGAISITSAGVIQEKVTEGFAVMGKQVKVTAAGGAKIKGGSGKFILKGSTLKIDTSKFGSGGGPNLKLKGKVDFSK